MAALGSGHLSALSARPELRLSFLQGMLGFAQQQYLPLADRALPFWVKTMQVRK
jgi:hypothetical protein